MESVFLSKSGFHAGQAKPILLQNGPLAQRSEQGTHIPLVAGSNPAGPIFWKDEEPAPIWTGG